MYKRQVLECILNDYLSFIIMLFGLFCVAGNITFTGDLAGSPAVNLIFLLIGTLLSSIIGTTGSSMLMLRPMIKINSWRRRKKMCIRDSLKVLCRDLNMTHVTRHSLALKYAARIGRGTIGTLVAVELRAVRHRSCLLYTSRCV